MNTKNINSESNLPNQKVITHGDVSFKLSLEFEENDSWEAHELINNCANVEVNTLDGRQYDLIVWTFNYRDARKSGL